MEVDKIKMGERKCFFGTQLPMKFVEDIIACMDVDVAGNINTDLIKLEKVYLSIKGEK